MKAIRYTNCKEKKYMFYTADVDTSISMDPINKKDERLTIVKNNICPILYLSETGLDNLVDICKNEQEEIAGYIRIYPKEWDLEFSIGHIPFIEVDVIDILNLYSLIKDDDNIVDYYEALDIVVKGLETFQSYDEDKSVALTMHVCTVIAAQAIADKARKITVFVPVPQESDVVVRIIRKLSDIDIDVCLDENINRIILNCVKERVEIRNIV